MNLPLGISLKLIWVINTAFSTSYRHAGFEEGMWEAKDEVCPISVASRWLRLAMVVVVDYATLGSSQMKDEIQERRRVVKG